MLQRRLIDNHTRHLETENSLRATLTGRRSNRTEAREESVATRGLRLIRLYAPPQQLPAVQCRTKPSKQQRHHSLRHAETEHPLTA